MDRGTAAELMMNYNGDYSLFYPILKQEIKAMNLPDEQFFGIPEICFFELDYLTYYLDILNREFCQRKIIDVGCQHGFQQVIFDKFEYVGIEIDKAIILFRDHGQFRIGDFTEMDIDLTDSIVISNMSLGYFNGWIHKSNKEIAEKLGKAEVLYLKAPKELQEQVKPYFAKMEVIEIDMQYSDKALLFYR